MRTCIRRIIVHQIVAVMAVGLFIIAGNTAWCQETGGVQAATPSVTINYRERPRYPIDPQRLKLRPTLDGEIGPSEWSPFATISDGPVVGTVYLNWDDDFLYIAYRTEAPAWCIVNVDTAGDGWLRGADNLELVVSPVDTAASAPLTVRVLDAAVNRDAPIWNDSAIKAADIALMVRRAGSGQVVEMAVPRGMAGLSLRPGALLGFRADFLPAGTTPVSTAPYEPHLLLDINLVESRAVGATGIVPRLSLADSQLVSGQDLEATLELINQVDTPRTIRSVSWTGIGPAQNYLKTLREVALPAVNGLKTTRLRYSSPLPDTIIPGVYQFEVTAVMDDGSTVAANTSFSVQEQFEIQLDAEPPQVALIGPTEIKLTVTVRSAVPGFKKADVVITPPASWEIKGKPKRSVNIHREDGTVRVVYTAIVPSATQTGDYQVTADVQWRGKTWTTHRVIKVTRISQGS